MRRPHLDLRPEDITAIADTREQTPLDLLIKTETGTLKCGDYSVLGLTDMICVERKSLADLVACVGRERDRFDACVKRMKGYEVRVLVIEASMGAIEAGMWRGQIKPTQVKAALYSWAKHVSIFPTTDRTSAAATVSGILFSAARERWRHLQAFHEALRIAPPKDAS
jgi:ERCC4-type nuclease